LPHVKAKDAEDIANGRKILVAIVRSGSPKLDDSWHELGLMGRPLALGNEDLVVLDANLLRGTLWIRVVLMERSWAGVNLLVDHELTLRDESMARFASEFWLFFPLVC
jgi:hypothetical protein